MGQHYMRHRSYYEETIDYYGQTLLDKYIVDGQFLKDKLERDIEKAQKQTKAADNYYKAFTAYLNHLASSTARRDYYFSYQKRVYSIKS